MQTLEREVTREQAQLLFDLPEDGTLFYQLKLVPKISAFQGADIEPFASEEEAEEFVAKFSRRLISATW